jgi:predicted kinase
MGPPNNVSRQPGTTGMEVRQEQQQTVSTSWTTNKQLDKDIKLKNNATQLHIHRCDLNLRIKKKPKTDDEEETLISAVLQRFHKIMLAADASTIIPAYLEMDRNDRAHPDLTQEYQVSLVEDFSTLKCYFSRLSSRNEMTGKVYCSVILAQSIPFASIINSSLNTLVRDELGLYQRASDHEAPGEIGWLCYSVRPQDEERLSSLLSDLCDEHIGVKWKIIHTSDGFKKWDPNDKSRPFALRVEGPSNRLQECRQKLLDWYGSDSKSFPDGTKMRFIPPWHNIFAQDNKVKVGTLVACQVALNERYAHATSYKFSTNLLINKPCPATRLSLHQVLMNIKSPKFPSCSLFHTIDKSYRDQTGVTFMFVPKNESDGRMYVAGLIPYLRSIHPWYLDQFTEAAKNRHRSSVWDANTQQIFSVDKLCIANNIYEDDNLNCTGESTLTRPTIANPDIAVRIREVQPSQSTPDIYRESDSVCTFNPPRRKPTRQPNTSSPTVLPYLPAFLELSIFLVPLKISMHLQAPPHPSPFLKCCTLPPCQAVRQRARFLGCLIWPHAYQPSNRVLIR